MQAHLKITARYIIIAFVLYLSYKVTSLHYINSYRNEGYALNTIVVSVLGALTLIIKHHFTTKVDNGDDKPLL